MSVPLTLLYEIYRSLEKLIESSAIDREHRSIVAHAQQQLFHCLSRQFSSFMLEWPQARACIRRGRSRGAHVAHTKTHRCVLFSTKDNDRRFHDIVPAHKNGQT